MPEDRLADPIVLIVEDDPMLAEEMSIALRRHGLAAVVAPDWETAIQHVASTPLDLIVLDQRLGSVDAVLRLPALRVLTRVPVLVLTANQAEADRILALETGADDFLLKPISGRELVARVRAHLRRIAPPPAPPFAVPATMAIFPVRTPADTPQWGGGRRCAGVGQQPSQ